MFQWLSLFTVLVICTATPSARAAETWTGKVIAVADGDTITVLHYQTPVTLRLQGVDAPEKTQPFGDQAKQLTSSLVLGKEVRVEVLGRDKYRRTLARVSYLGPLHRNPRDAAQPHQAVTAYYSLEESLLQAGLAWWFRRYSIDAKLALIEDQAKHDKRGLWADPNPTPPWEWRHPDMVCRKDADCVFLPPVCAGCTPCKPTWRRIGNVSALRRIQSTQARVRCAKPSCQACADPKNWISGKLVCDHGMCRSEPAAATQRGAPSTGPGLSALYHGNAKSKVLHAPGCRDYACKGCTTGFSTVDEARRAGYRRHPPCIAAFETCYRGCLERSRARAVSLETIEAACRQSCSK